MVKVISRTPICGVLYFLEYFQVQRTICIYNIFTLTVFREQSCSSILLRQISVKSMRYTGNTWDAPAHGSYKPLTIFFSIEDCDTTFGFDSMPPLLRAATSYCHDSELRTKEYWCSKMLVQHQDIITAQCCMKVIHLEVDMVLLTSWIALKRLQSKFVSSKARSQVLIPKILTDLCCSSSFSAKGF